jgi:hypothetical protein
LSIQKQTKTKMESAVKIMLGQVLMIIASETLRNPQRPY